MSHFLDLLHCAFRDRPSRDVAQNEPMLHTSVVTCQGGLLFLTDAGLKAGCLEPKRPAFRQEGGTMAKLRLTMACWNYDRTRALLEERVPIDGIELPYIKICGEESFFRRIGPQEWEV